MDVPDPRAGRRIPEIPRLCRLAATAAAVAFWSAGPLAAQGGLVEAERSCPCSSWPWARNTLVVNIPSHLASDPVTQLSGMAFALTLVPIDLIQQGIHGSTPDQDRKIPKYAHIGLCGGVLLGKGVALAVGAPFWLLEEAFWDLPVRLIRGPRKRHAEAAAPQG